MTPLRARLQSGSLFFLAFCLPFAAGATNYYVAPPPAGSNSHPGTLSEPWATVQFGVDQLSAGDTLWVLAGTYAEKVFFTPSGTPGNPVTLRAFGDGPAILDGTGLGGPAPMLEITDRAHLEIRGLTIANHQQLDAQGILVSGTSHHVTIRDNEIYRIDFSTDPDAPVDETTNAQPLIVYGTHPVTPVTVLAILDNVIRDSRTGYSEGLAINGNVDGFEVRGNRIHDLTNIGIDVIGHEGTSPDPATDQARNGVVSDNIVTRCRSDYATSAGIYVDGGRNLVIERNLSSSNGYGIEIGCEAPGRSAANVEVRNNLVWDNEIAGIAFGGYDFPSGSGKVVDSVVRHNTFWRNDTGDSFTGEMYLSYSEGSSLHHNIFATTSQNVAGYLDATPVALDLDFNLYFAPGGSASLEFDWNGVGYAGLTTFQAGTGNETEGLHGNPAFVDPSLPDPDLHLQASSPAVDTGNPLFAPGPGETDIDGEVRTLGPRVDRGADEHSGAAIFADGFESGSTGAW